MAWGFEWIAEIAEDWFVFSEMHNQKGKSLSLPWQTRSRSYVIFCVINMPEMVREY